jgi:Domain of unknown function (DUF4272)
MRACSQFFIAICLVACCLAVGCSKGPSDMGEGAGGPLSEEFIGEGVAQTLDGYPVTSSWEAASERQAQRADRSFAILKQRQVPAYDGPLFVADDEAANLQSAQDVAKRTLVLWAVELRAEGVARDEAIALIEKLDLWDSVSPQEKLFLESEEPDPETAKALVWRLESIWVLLWSLGYIEELEWPTGMCDVTKLVKILKPLESDPNFISGAKLRSKAEILDQQDLAMRIHWAIRDASLSDAKMVPKGLDWTNRESMVPIELSPSVGVVEQRHYVLNWLVRYLDPKDWDNVDTPT